MWTQVGMTRIKEFSRTLVKSKTSSFYRTLTMSWLQINLNGSQTTCSLLRQEDLKMSFVHCYYNWVGMNKRKKNALEGDIYCILFWKPQSPSELEMPLTFLCRSIMNTEQMPPKTWNMYIQVSFSVGLFWELEYFKQEFDQHRLQFIDWSLA